MKSKACISFIGKATTLLMTLIISSNLVIAQTKSVSGTVVDVTGEPIIGANVIVQGTQNGSITSVDGDFALSDVKSSDVLVISFIGYTTKTVSVGNQSVFKVVLSEDSQMLEEVVAIGYGTVRRKDLTGSVSSVNSEKLTAVPVASPVEALQGKMAGVRITNPDGSPDADVVIRVRGGGSITSDNSPLYIVDGFPVNSISDISASDIEDITVLKDASSTAIYGSRAANGIIMVTTKSGKAGNVKVNYNAYVGSKKCVEYFDVLDTEDYLRWQYEAFALGGSTATFVNDIGPWGSIPTAAREVSTTDWQREIFGRTGNVFNHNLSISGGSDKLRFNFGYNHMNEKAILMDSRFKKDNLSLKVNYDANKHVKLDFSARYSRTQVWGDGQSDATGQSGKAPAGASSRFASTVTHNILNMTGEGTYKWSQSELDDNIDNGADVDVKDNYKIRQRQNFNMNGALSWEIIKNLKFRSEIGLDIDSNQLKYFFGSSTYESKNNAQADYKNAPLTNTTLIDRRTTRNTNTLSYDFAGLLGKHHGLQVMMGQETIIKKESLTTTRIEGFPLFYDADMAFSLSAQGTPTRANTYNFEDDKMYSFFGRVNYDFEHRYLFTATLRADGSSKFSEGNRWGIFPSAALAWRVIDESFMESTHDWLSDLKLRVSYGVTGNNNIPSGQTTKTYSVNQNAWMNIYSSFLSAGTTLDNQNLKWETTYSINAGIDFGFFNGSLNGSIEIYQNNVKDLLMNMSVTGSGYNTQYQNVGETENKGFEFSLNWSAINKKDYGLDFGLTVGHNINKIKSLGTLTEGYYASSYWASTEIIGDYLVKPGYAIGTMWGYETDGRYEVSDFDHYDAQSNTWVLKDGVVNNSNLLVRPGSLKLVDQPDADGKKDNVITEDDRVKIGDANAWAVGGFSINGRVKWFDLSANFTYSIGNDLYNADKINMTSTRGSKWKQFSTRMASGSRWTNLDANGNLINDATTLGQLNQNTTMWSPYLTKAIMHSWAIEDGSFLRLSNITLGYTMPQTLTRKVLIERLRIYCTASNLFCLTGYSGLDPEVDSARNNLVTPGVDFSAYPKTLQIIFGLNLTF